jgi:hypothetical protein
MPPTEGGYFLVMKRILIIRFTVTIQASLKKGKTILGKTIKKALLSTTRTRRDQKGKMIESKIFFKSFCHEIILPSNIFAFAAPSGLTRQNHFTAP